MKNLIRLATFRHGKTCMEEHQTHLKANQKILLLIFFLSFVYSLIDAIVYTSRNENTEITSPNLLIALAFQLARLILFIFYSRLQVRKSTRRFLLTETLLVIVFIAAVIFTWNAQIDLDPSRTYVVGVEAGWTFLYTQTLFGVWPLKAIIYISASAFGIYRIIISSDGSSMGIVQSSLQIVLAIASAFIEELRNKRKLLHSISLQKTEQTLRNILNSLPDNIAILNLRGDIRFYNDYFGISFKIDDNVSSANIFSQIMQVKPRERHLNLQKIQERYNFTKPMPRRSLKPTELKPVRRNTLVKGTNNPLIRYLTDEHQQTNHRLSSLLPTVEPKETGRSIHSRRLSKTGPLKTLTEFFASVNYFKDLQEVLEFFCMNVDIIRTYTEKERSFFIFDAKYQPGEAPPKSFEIKVSLSTFDNEESFIVILRDTTHRDIIVTLEDNNNFKDSVLASISHELRTPLNTNLNLLQLAIDAFGKMNKFNDNKSYALSFIDNNDQFNKIINSDNAVNDLKELYLVPAHKSGKLLESLINDILDYSMLIARKFNPNVKGKYLMKSIEKIRYLCEFQARKKNLEFHISLSQAINYKIGTDHRRLRQILTNLLNNAIRFTNKGFISLRIEPYCENPELIQFTVKDSGIGIESEILERMLDLLDSGNFLNKLNKESSGVGLGLIISHLLARELGPSAARMSGIKIESTPNEGSKFWFVLQNWTKAYEKQSTKISDWGRMKHEKTEHNTNNDMSLGSPSRKNSLQVNKMTVEKTNHTLEFPKFIKKSVAVESDTVLGKEEEIEDEIARMIKNDNIKMNSIDKKLSKRDSHTTSNFSKNINKGLQGSEPASGVLHTQKDQAYGLFNQHDGSNYLDPRKAILMESRGQESTEIREETPIECTCPEILVVDDDMFNLFTIENLFATLNFRIAKANNGEDAIKVVQRRQELRCGEQCRNFKLILMDLSMPIMDGFQATLKLKEMMKNKQIPDIFIVACTAFVDQDKTDKCYECGMEGRISKPVNKNKLREVLKKYGVIEREED